MDANSIVSFVRIIRSYPEIRDNKRKFKKKVESLIEDTYNFRRKKLRKDLDLQKEEIFECYEKYNEIMADGLEDAILNGEEGGDRLIEKMVEAFFKNKEKEKENVEETETVSSKNSDEG